MHIFAVVPWNSLVLLMVYGREITSLRRAARIGFADLDEPLAVVFVWEQGFFAGISQDDLGISERGLPGPCREEARNYVLQGF
jgi:hypothetical protein